MNDQMRRLPILRKARGIPLLVILAIVPQRAAEIVVREEQLFRGILVQGAEDTVVGDEGFELAAEGVALDPVDHEAAVGGAEGDGAGGVDVREVGGDVFEAFDEIDVWTAAPVVLNAVLEVHAIAGRAGGIGSYHDVAGFGKDSRVPTCGPAFVPHTLRLYSCLLALC